VDQLRINQLEKIVDRTSIVISKHLMKKPRIASQKNIFVHAKARNHSTSSLTPTIYLCVITTLSLRAAHTN
jgi:hypothetical protein